jgi:hypothetical protein
VSSCIMQVCFGQVKMDTGSDNKPDNLIDKPFQNCLVHNPKRLSEFPYLHFYNEENWRLTISYWTIGFIGTAVTVTLSYNHL